MIGKRLGSYEVTAKLGEGGMGEVYRATDTKLKREVAIKVLPAAFTDDKERLARFEREAQLLAQLNHPNIAQIYGLETSGTTHALVMELVDGPTLAERLEQGPFSLTESFSCALQIAQALEEAHGKGIVHRDLKPQNVKASSEGKAKVLDFGLAKAMDSGTSPSSAADFARSPTIMNSPTLTAVHGTQLGVILGTAAYMAPEQARGAAVDKRADIWAFGVVLYEMLTGRSLFAGPTVSDTLAGVLKTEIDWQALPTETPAEIRRLLRRCLERNPKNRLHDIADARLVLEEVIAAGGKDEPSSLAPLAPVTPAPASARGVPSRWVAAALVAALAIGAAAAWLVARGALQRDRGPGVAFEPKTFGRQKIFGARFLPDGRGIVYGSALAGNRPEIFLLAAGSMTPQKIGPQSALVLSVSKRGELAILTDTTYMNHRVLEGTLARMAVDGAPRPLVESVRDADWGADDELAIVRRHAGVDALEYPPGKVLYQTSGYVSEPRVSPDGSRVAFLDHPWWIDDRGWVKVVDRAGKVETLAGEYWAVEGLAWAPGGQRLLFSGAAENNPQLQPRSVALAGGAVRTEVAAPGELLVVDVAADGRWLAIAEEGFYGVAVRRPNGQPDLDLSWLDLSWSVSLSPDGETVAFSNGHGGANYTVVTRRLDGSPISTLGEGEALGFSPDGAWVAAKIPTPAQFVVYPTGTGVQRALERGSIERYEAADWFPDSRSLLFTASEPARPPRSFRQSIDGGPPQAVTPEGIYGTLSPRGDRILAQDGDANWRLYPLEGGEPRPVAGLGRLEEIAAWSPDGESVYARRVGEVPMRLDRVDLATGRRTPSLSVGPPDEVGLVRVRLGEDSVLDPGRPFAYEYLRRFSTLYLVTGVEP